jgi:hypothetical protein
MKIIAIYCDGTWNTPDKMEAGKHCQTNLVKMANALSPESIDGIRNCFFMIPESAAKAI